MNQFDALQDTMFSTVANTMGYSTTWTPCAIGSIEHTAVVLYKGPTEKEKLLSANYNPENLTMEYKAGDLPQLYEAAKGNQTFEQVRIEGIGLFAVSSVRRLFDGKTYEASLQFISE